MAPIIGITQSSRLSYSLKVRTIVSRNAYFLAVRAAGGIPLALDNPSVGNPIPSEFNRCDGILFSGGGDINPQFYGKQSNTRIREVDESRDTTELALVKQVIENDLPFLAICRGLQLINVARGGSLYRDLHQEHPSPIEHDWQPSRRYFAHAIKLVSSSQLISKDYPNTFEVNSLHHQGVQDTGMGLKAIAVAEDGLVEAIELTGHRFGLAVQWHPEWLVEHWTARVLFESFIDACRE